MSDIKHFVQGVESLLEVSMYKRNDQGHHQQICLPWLIYDYCHWYRYKDLPYRMWISWNWHMGGDYPWNSMHMKQFFGANTKQEQWIQRSTSLDAIASQCIVRKIF
jgi:hypothetical protein